MYHTYEMGSGVGGMKSKILPTVGMTASGRNQAQALERVKAKPSAAGCGGFCRHSGESVDVSTASGATGLGGEELLYRSLGSRVLGWAVPLQLSYCEKR